MTIDDNDKKKLAQMGSNLFRFLVSCSVAVIGRKSKLSKVNEGQNLQLFRQKFGQILAEERSLAKPSTRFDLLER